MSTPSSALIKPGLFGLNVAADARRGVYDAQNEELLAQQIAVDAVFIGDSITEMWALDAYFRPVEGLIANRGIGGDITPYIRRRFEADALQLRPRLIVMLAGINNFWDLDNWLSPEQIRQPGRIANEIVGDITAMVRAAREQDIFVAVCSILPTNIPVFSSNATRNQAVKHVNQQLQEVAVEQGAVFVDYHRRFVKEDGLTLLDGYTDDGLHPRASGYRIMAETLLAALQERGIAVITSRR